MTHRFPLLPALGIALGLGLIFWLVLHGRYEDCYIAAFFGSISGFFPHELLREKCFERTIGFLFFFFQ